MIALPRATLALTAQPSPERGGEIKNLIIFGKQATYQHESPLRLVGKLPNRGIKKHKEHKKHKTPKTKGTRVWVSMAAGLVSELLRRHALCGDGLRFQPLRPDPRCAATSRAELISVTDDPDLRWLPKILAIAIDEPHKPYYCGGIEQIVGALLITWHCPA